MKNYEEVLETVELALSKGEYHFCIEFLSPIIDSYPISSKEGINLRTILITAFCGINKKENAKEFCKELLKSHDNKIKENAKYLMEVIDSPEIKKPNNWNINFERNNTSFSKRSLGLLNHKKNILEKKKFINITDLPTGETKPFQRGFTFIIFLILLLLIPLLSGCVKIENTIDLSEFDSINNNLIVESKYTNKFPWQIKFEEEIKNIFPKTGTLTGESNFSIKNKNLSLEDAEETLNKIIKIGGNLAGGSANLKFDSTEKNFIFFKKYNFKMSFDLKTISNLDNLEFKFRIIYPNKASLNGNGNPQAEINKNLIVWNLIPGQLNILEFSFWNWNKFLIGINLILFLIIITYILRFYRFKLGTDLPQLPSE